PDMVASNFVQFEAQQRASGSNSLVAYLNTQIGQVRAKIQSAEQLLLGSTPAGLYGQEDRLKQLTETVSDLRKNLVTSNAELVRARGIYRDRHPKLLTLQSENQEIRNNIEQSEREMGEINQNMRRYSIVEGELS